MEETRVDRWLWAVRAAATRSGATALCRGGHVRVNGTGAKAATTIRPGDTVTARIAGRDRVLEVVQTIDKRVGAAAAAGCLIDRSPPPPPRELRSPVLQRDPSSGRPTKRDRRQIDRLRGR
ncbi:MAG: hslR [Acidimicrobiaceae bacterium]|nr:hslR [Acidimicrobiaceae bacterium]